MLELSLSYSLSGADAAAFSTNAGLVLSTTARLRNQKYLQHHRNCSGIESSNQATAILIRYKRSPIINGLISPISFTENSVANVVTVNAGPVLEQV